MSTLDSPPSIEQSTISPYPTAIRYGLIGGLVLMAYTLIGNLTGITRPSGGFGMIAVVGLISIVIYVSILVMAVRKHRNEDLGGYITFGRAFVVALIAAIIASIMSALFNYLYATVIDPTYSATMMEDMQTMYEKLGMSEEQIEQAMQQASASFTPTTMLTNGILYSGVIGAVIALIIAAIMQKKPKMDTMM